MSLSSAQLQTLHNDILADPILNAFPNNSDGNTEIANRYALNASPIFTVWKSNVMVKEIATCINGTELAGLTANNHTRLQTVAIYFSEGMNASLVDMRQMLDDIFSGTGGANTRSRLLVMYKRLAWRIEKLYATGAGSDTVPATMSYEGPISYQDVEQARALP